MVDVITADKDRWVDVMMKEELEMQREKRSPVKTATATFLAFIAAGLIPLLSYIFAQAGGTMFPRLFLTPIVLTSLTFVGIGTLKSFVNNTRILRSIFDTLALGGIAAIAAYLVDDFLDKIIM